MKAASFQYIQLSRTCVVFYHALGKAKQLRIRPLNLATHSFQLVQEDVPSPLYIRLLCVVVMSSFTRPMVNPNAS